MAWRWRGARTTGDDRLEVDDRVGEGSAVECLAGHLERREEERCGHRREKELYSVDVGRAMTARDLALPLECLYCQRLRHGFKRVRSQAP